MVWEAGNAAGVATGFIGTVPAIETNRRIRAIPAILAHCDPRSIAWVRLPRDRATPPIDRPTVGPRSLVGRLRPRPPPR
ncbi:MAG: hypothetical protein ACO4AJ_07175, partial [Prochlorothrix sp.]